VIRHLRAGAPRRQHHRQDGARAREAWLDSVVRFAPDAIVVVDAAGGIALANPAAEVMFGYPPGELAGRPVESLVPDCLGTGRGHGRHLAATPSQLGVGVRMELAGRRRSGGRFPVELSRAAFDSDQGPFTAVVIRDLTSSRTAERRWQQARDRAVAASRLKSQFVATMSHEIRTPMNGVIGLTDLLLATDLTPTQRRYVEGVRISGEALMGVINDVLDFSKIEQGRFVLEETDFNLGLLLEDVVTITAQSAAAKGLHVQVDRDPDLPLSVRGDPCRIRQILLNLVGNAVKFTEQGGIAIHARPGAAHGPGTAPDEVMVRLEVVDTGVGIGHGTLQHLFEPFVQADPSTTRTHGGSGLGLTICRQLAEAMGGWIEAESEPGQGTTLRVLLPLRRAAGRPGTWRAACGSRHGSRATARTAQEPPGAPAEVSGPEAPGRILVVEDNEISQAVVVGALTSIGYTVDVAADGLEALERAGDGDYQAILMDCHMPRMDGFTAAEELRRRPATARTPILAMTADVLKEQRERCIASGMDGYIAKPVRPHELRAVLAGWTGYHGGRTVAPAEPDAAAPVARDRIRLRLIEILGDRTPREVALVARIVTSFPAKARQLLHDMTAAAEREDAAAALHAHSLKGAAANLGATTLAGLCQDVESAARSGAWQRIPDRLPPLREALAAFEADLAVVRRGIPDLTAGDGA